MAGFLNCKRRVWPIKFLGIPIGVNHIRKEVWKVSKRLASWDSHFLSFRGSVVLINAILNALSVYLFSFDKTLKIVIKSSTEIQRVPLGGVGARKTILRLSGKLCGRIMVREV
ncbi:hypothetical protein Lalb_Chr03g0036711 [Lupinus albus]|uniref:Uncharacterized protein n=1 Tax=Lupinus albus TaxID=3870 RepID=A0A6A4QWF0_LUPAL|nr:hypothetical protein Lalb_Chr03g0036711 [Lupinus albus]